MSRKATSPTSDCAIAGAGPAGLNAALVLGRARVLVLDNGSPRNYATHEMHGVLALRQGFRVLGEPRPDRTRR